MRALLQNLAFQHWQFLLLLPLLPVLAWLKGRRGPQAAFVYSSLGLVKGLTGISRSRAGTMLMALRWLALTCLIVGLARPQWIESETSVKASGVDIVVAIDLSGSMDAVDFALNGREATRCDMAKDVLAKFIVKRPSDRIGLVAFAGRPYVAAPLTLDHDFLQQNLERLTVGTIQERNTAIGSALAVSVNRLRDLKSKTKIVILMTDGRNNAGKVDPQTATEAAAALKVKIYAIGVGKKGGSFVYVSTPIGRMRQGMADDLDEELLQQIADKTGGKYYRADNALKFRQIYDEIDKLEKTEAEVKKYVHRRELMAWAVGAGLLVLLLELALAQTLFRRMP